jgi:hypothetical protein
VTSDLQQLFNAQVAARIYSEKQMLTRKLKKALEQRDAWRCKAREYRATILQLKGKTK